MRRLVISLASAALLMGALTAQVVAKATTDTWFWWNETSDLGVGFERADELVLDDSARIWILAEAEAIGIDIAGNREVERFSVP